MHVGAGETVCVGEGVHAGEGEHARGEVVHVREKTGSGADTVGGAGL